MSKKKTKNNRQGFFSPSKVVRIGKLSVGGKYPIRLQGMIKTSYNNPQAVIQELKALEQAGAEIVRMAIREEKDLEIFKILRKISNTVFVADIHFQAHLAQEAIACGFDAIRLNPLNISKRKEVKEIIKKARIKQIPIRIGINSGGFKRKMNPHKMAQAMNEKVEQYLEIFKDCNFFDIMVSLKAADVLTTILANQLFRKRHPFPLQLGVTATGPYIEGIIKSAIGIGTLLQQGIGEIVRVSLNASSVEEIHIAKYILAALGKREPKYEIIACPTCSRCEVDLIKIVEDFKQKIEGMHFKRKLKIALMGCVVNGPGEALQADIGIAFGKDKGVIFKDNSILGYTDKKRVVNDLIKKVEEICN